MASRSRRDTHVVAALNTTESLILAQAVWQNGSDAWPTVAKVISKHPLVSRPKSFFTAQSTHTMYENLMKEARLEWTEACNTRLAPVNHALADRYYRIRVAELRGLILDEEEKFKTIVSEIEMIRSGNYDADIKAKISDIPATPITTSEVPQEFEPSRTVGTSVATAQIPADDAKSSTQSREPEILDEASYGAEDSESMSIDPISLSPPTSNQAEHSGHQVVENETPAIQEPSEVIISDSSPAPAPETPEKGQPVIHPGAPEDHREEEEELEEIALVTERRNTVHEEEEEEEEGEEEKKLGMHNVKEDNIEKRNPESPRGQEASDSLTVQDTPAQKAKSPLHVVPLASEAEQTIEDSESSSEEPLHVSRRSTRRRRSVVSPIQPLQTRGKARRQRANSAPMETKEEEPDVRMDEVEGDQDVASTHEMDQDEPADDTVRRREGKRKTYSTEGVESPREKKRARDDSEPVDEDESGPSSQVRGRRQAIRSDALKRFQNVIGMLHSQISQHRNGNIFHNPIKDSEAPDYHEIVKRPIDLKTIKVKVKDGSIANSLEYQRDIYLMFANAMMYNRPGSDVHSMAEDMMIESEGHILAFRQTEGLVRGVHRT